MQLIKYFVLQLISLISLSAGTNFVEIVSILDDSSSASCLIKTHSIIESAAHKSLLSFRFLILENHYKNFTVNRWEKIFMGCFPGVRHESKAWVRPASLAALSGRQFEIDAIYARFYLPRIFPTVARFVYLDNDIVVNADIQHLFMEKLVITDTLPELDSPGRYGPVPQSAVASSSVTYAEMRKNVIALHTQQQQHLLGHHPHAHAVRRLERCNRTTLASHGPDDPQAPVESSCGVAACPTSDGRHAQNDTVYRSHHPMTKKQQQPQYQHQQQQREQQQKEWTKRRRRRKLTNAGRRDSTAPVGFVFEKSAFYRTYIQNHFNLSDNHVRQVVSLRGDDVFLNGGVFVVDAAMWRKLGLTGKAEEIIKANANERLYRAEVGDQGAFFLLLEDRVAYLPPRFNMRRLPVHSVKLLEQGMAGVVHFAGTTRGNALFLCEFPTTHTLLLPAAVPLYLAVVQSFLQQCPASPYSRSLAAQCVDYAAPTVAAALKSDRTAGHFESGVGHFQWPLPKLKLEIS